MVSWQALKPSAKGEIGIPLRKWPPTKWTRRRWNWKLDKIKSNGYAFQIEMVYRCYKKGCKIGEISIIFYERMMALLKRVKKLH